MRLWHYEMIPFLPRQQLLSQWRELNSIYKKQDNHVLINYIYEYPKDDLYWYSQLVIAEMKRRGYRVKSWDNYMSYFEELQDTAMCETWPRRVIKHKLFVRHHNERYLIQCFYNLQEKYDRGAITQQEYILLEAFMKERGCV